MCHKHLVSLEAVMSKTEPRGKRGQIRGGVNMADLGEPHVSPIIMLRMSRQPRTGVAEMSYGIDIEPILLRAGIASLHIYWFDTCNLGQD